VGRLPIVPAAVLFDLLVGDMRIRPDAAAGYAACAAATAKRPAEGNVGAGTGAAVGKIFGIERAMKGGVGTASVTVGGVTVGALIACNALGDVLDPDTAQVVAGARTANGRKLLDTRRACCAASARSPAGWHQHHHRRDRHRRRHHQAAGHRWHRWLTRRLARSINPVHTMSDGDTLFALGTGRAKAHPGMMVLGTMAAEATARATLRAVLAARGLTAGGLHLPAARDL
jgi:L-aminopeptidase/D-esterase-like protein